MPTSGITGIKQFKQNIDYNHSFFFKVRIWINLMGLKGLLFKLSHQRQCRTPFSGLCTAIFYQPEAMNHILLLFKS